MKRPLRVGIAGYGVIGQRRRQVIDAHPALKLVAIGDKTFKRRERLGNGPRQYHDCRDLVAAEQLDVLFVCLPNYLAAPMTLAGLKRGFHVFCEKPPGRTLAEIDAVYEYTKRRPDLKLKYGFNHRYHDSVRDALEILAKGELGRVISLRGVYGKSKIIPFADAWRGKRKYAGGGILLDQGIHMVDLIRLFAGEFVDVHSFISNDFWRHDVEDNAYALMRTRTGVVAMVHSSATSWRHRFHLDVTLERGALILSGILSGSRSYGAETLTVVYAGQDDSGDPKEQTTRYNQDHSWRDEIDEFVEAILQNKPVSNGSCEDAVKTMELIYRIYCADSVWRSAYKLRGRLSGDLAGAAR